jgi:hypothetical protein
MRRNSFFATLHLLGAVIAASQLAGCSVGSTAMTPRQMPEHGLTSQTSLKFAGHYSCPATGPIEYVSDSYDSTVYVFAGKFSNQAPCGQITSGLNFPQCMYVDARSHDLYVANLNTGNILVFHRGQPTAYNTYTDPTGQVPFDVTLASDGTVIASNYYSQGGSGSAVEGSISTWVAGPNGGTFVRNYPMMNDSYGQFVTVDKSGKVYYSDLDALTDTGALWSLQCPAGVCGAQTRVAGVSFWFPGGMAFNETGDLVAVDTHIGRTGNAVDTFELPNPSPSTFPLVTGWPTEMAIDRHDHHVFVADQDHSDAAEYLYPSGTLVGTVQINSQGRAIGVAIDP